MLCTGITKSPKKCENLLEIGMLQSVRMVHCIGWSSCDLTWKMASISWSSGWWIMFVCNWAVYMASVSSGITWLIASVRNFIIVHWLYGLTKKNQKVSYVKVWIPATNLSLYSNSCFHVCSNVFTNVKFPWRTLCN